MSTQYDEIAAGYNDIYSNPDDPASQFEEANMYAAISAQIKGKRVLDLACGTGHYSRKFLEWGALEVVGVDISPGMVELARNESKEADISETKLSFVVGDASKPLDLSTKGAPFDIVASAWFLNYAPNAQVMEAMWRTIAANLKPEGMFVGLTIPPHSGDRTELNRVLAEECARFGTSGHVIREVEDGFEVHIVLGFPGSTQIEFDNYYLRNHVFEKTAKNGGMSGGLEWQDLVLLTKSGRPKGF